METKTLTGPDYSAYDAFIAAHRHGSVFQTRDWMRYQFAAFGRGGELIVVEKAGEILCSALIVYHSLPFGKSYAYVPRGPLFSPDNKIANGMLLNALRREASRGSGIFILMDPLILIEEGWSSVTSSEKLHAASSHQPNTTLVIDLRPDEDAILTQMKEKGRYNVRLAVKKGVTVRQGRMDELYPILVETAGRDGFAIHPREVYEAMLETFGNGAELLVAEQGGEVLCGGIFLFAGQTGIYYYGASRSERRELMAPYLLQWEAMRHAKERGCTEYDLLGIADPDAENHPLAGVTEFKTKFGGEVRQYVGARKMVVNRLWNTLYELRRKF